MRYFLLVLGILFFSTSLKAQNPMMREFGSSFDDVKQFLVDRHCQMSIEEDLILASKGEISLEYHFRNDRLYQMSVEKKFDKKKASAEAMDAFRNHYQLVGAEIVEMVQGKSDQSFVAMHQRDLNEITCTRGEDKLLAVRLTSRNLDFYPDERKAMLNEEMRNYSALSALSQP